LKDNRGKAVVLGFIIVWYCNPINFLYIFLLYLLVVLFLYIIFYIKSYQVVTWLSVGIRK